MGGASVLEAADRSGAFAELHAGDANADLIELYRAVADGWDPPDELSFADWQALRDLGPMPLRTFAGFGCSFGGKWFQGYARGRSRNYAGSAARGLRRARGTFVRTEWHQGDYSALSGLVDARTVLYCDPPYAATTGYKAIGGTFDHAAFWRWCRLMAGTGARVFVSEYRAPDDVPVREVWSRTGGQSLNNTGTGDRAAASERLFLVEG